MGDNLRDRYLARHNEGYDHKAKTWREQIYVEGYIEGHAAGYLDGLVSRQTLDDDVGLVDED